MLEYSYPEIQVNDTRNEASILELCCFGSHASFFGKGNTWFMWML